MEEMNEESPVQAGVAPVIVPKSQIVIDLDTKSVSAPESIHIVEGTLSFGAFLPSLGVLVLPTGFKSSQPSSPTSNFDVSGFVKFIETSAPLGLSMIKKAISAFESKR